MKHYVSYINRGSSIQDIGITDVVEHTKFQTIENKVIDWIIENSLEQFGCYVFDPDEFAEFKRLKKGEVYA